MEFILKSLKTMFFNHNAVQVMETKTKSGDSKNKTKEEVNIQVAHEKHLVYVDDILDHIEKAAKIRGTGIAKRSPDYIKDKIMEGKAVIALSGHKFAGFCYIESWGHQKFVANSGLIVTPDFRGKGLAKKIKRQAFELSRKKFPKARLFGLTTSLAVMKINSELGYRPVTFSELTTDDDFWKGCESCVNHDILIRTNRSHCLCTGMIYDPEWEDKKTDQPHSKKHALKTYGRWLKFKKNVLMKLKNNE